MGRYLILTILFGVATIISISLTISVFQDLKRAEAFKTIINDEVVTYEDCDGTFYFKSHKPFQDTDRIFSEMEKYLQVTCDFKNPLPGVNTFPTLRKGERSQFIIGYIWQQQEFFVYNQGELTFYKAVSK